VAEQVPASVAEGATAEEGSVLEGGSYEIIRRRLLTRGRELADKAGTLNAARQQVFGGIELDVIGQERIRSENNCVPVDIATVGDHLLFGYNVFIGLKKTTHVADVFSLHRIARTEDGGVGFVADDDVEVGAFLRDERFVREFGELYQYYAETRLVRISRTPSKLLAVFRVGERIDNVRVFRWAIDAAGELTYLDNRGERDHVMPPSHDFEWTPTSRTDHILGEHPHISILDEVFVETVGGDLTVKVEDNTADGLGIYREPVDDPNQSLDDADIRYAKLGALIVMRILPFQEQQVRYLVFNTRTKRVLRVDSIGQSCVQLPEDHGIVFPGGYCLQTGDSKVFAEADDGLLFKRRVVAPNGEDVLYVFERPSDGLYVLLPYNLIRKEVAQAIRGHGYSLFEDGAMVVFRAHDEPTRVHPMQIWRTPFVTAEFAAAAPDEGGELARIGNADLVRGISDAYTLTRLIEEQRPTRELYESLVSSTDRVVDSYYWLASAESGDLLSTLKEIRSTSELIIDEFEKVLVLRQQAAEALTQAASEQDRILSNLRVEDFRSVDHYMDALSGLRTQRGQLIGLREVRYVDLDRIAGFEERIEQEFDRVSKACVEFLLQGDAFAPLAADLDRLLEQVEACTKVTDFEPLVADQDRMTDGLNLLTEVISGLQVDDAVARAAVLEAIGEVFAHNNRVRAILQRRRKELGSREAKADFAAQFKLLGQSVASAVALSETPEQCDDNLSRLMLQLEELEARFGEFEDYLPQLTAKREEVYEALGARKQALLDARARRVGGMASAATRILDGLVRRARTFGSEDELNAWFATDAMVLKLRQIATQLGGLGEAVKGEEVLARLTTTRQDALRSLRDKLDLFEDGDSLIRLGRHRFAVNTQPLELTMLPTDGAMQLCLTGTDYVEVLKDDEVDGYASVWEQALPSETATVYRAEYLAASMLFAAERATGGLTVERLTEASLVEAELLELVRGWTAERYAEGYERGVHDVDAARILAELVRLRGTAGLLRFSPVQRALAVLFFAWGEDVAARQRWSRRARSLGRLRAATGAVRPMEQLADELADGLGAWLDTAGLDVVLGAAGRRLAGAYLAEELTKQTPEFVVSKPADALRLAVKRQLDDNSMRTAFEADLDALSEAPAERFALAAAWARALAEDEDVAIEATVALLTERELGQRVTSAASTAELTDLLGQHPRVRDGRLALRLDGFLQRLSSYVAEGAPRFERWRALRHEVLLRERERLRVDEFLPKVMSAFVRNRLIDEVYLPIVGDNLAKQLGAAGAARRTDQMGLLLLVSPPGYGKTTLMEYVANRLGLVFMKVNGPALGHEVTSLDPAEAPNATARQEVEKINLSLEMGNNVMLYLDDIQHTNPELLQKFISLCDATRRIEGVWKGRTRTYDMRGRKFCVVMAGNPYTESGERFQIPDMLANRADTYNLGDILQGKDDLFALSYVENSLTSNPVLQPLATRDQSDVYLLIRMAAGEEVPSSDLSWGYSAVELGEITAVLKRLAKVQEVVLRVNQQYIASAAQEDAYRTEPSFKLQGSYRNMNKMGERVVAAMNDDELDRMIDDHYAGEAQTLTTGAEANLLKLGEMLGTLSEERAARWAEICKEFRRLKLTGSGEDDPVARVTGVLSSLDQRLEAIGAALVEGATGDLGEGLDELANELEGIRNALSDEANAKRLDARVYAVGQALDGIKEVLANDTDEKRLDARVYAVAQELAGLRKGVDAATAGLAQLNLLEWLVPEFGSIEDETDVAKLQHEVLQQAQEALRSGREGVLPPLGQRDKVLAGTLPVIQDLFVAISETTSENLSDAAWEELMDRLREHVAIAVTRLARISDKP
jgi:hypothetical protein